MEWNDELEDCWFYHTMDLPELGTVPGIWDLRDRFDDYIGHVPVQGKTLLDVGTASGFLSFEAEKRGAIVTSFDLPTEAFGEVEHLRQYASVAKQMRNGYRLAHRLFGSKATFADGDAQQLSRHVASHHIVLLAQMLVHVRDPAAVIQQACAVARETVIVVEGSFESETPVALYLGAKAAAAGSLWHYSVALYRELFASFGFTLKSAVPATYRCDQSGHEGMTPVWTLVADRNP